MIPTIENILKALFAGDMDVVTASRYIATHIEMAERRAATPPLMAAVPAQTGEGARLAELLNHSMVVEHGNVIAAFPTQLQAIGWREELRLIASRLAALAHSPTVASPAADRDFAFMRFPEMYGAPALVAEVGEDTKRLDWLDTQAKAYGFADVHEGNLWDVGGAYRTVREAIDCESAASPVVIAGEVKP